jgi:hypothetical protein
MLLLEVFRQGAFTIAHQGVGVPLTWHFVTHRLTIEWRERPASIGPLEIFHACLSVRVATRLRRGEPFRLTWTFELRTLGRLIATGVFDGWVLAPDRYFALRRTRQSEAPQNRGPRVSPTAGGWTVGWNESDRFLFTRPADHVVSMALADAVFAARDERAMGARELAFDIEFAQFAESAPEIVLRPDPAVDPAIETFTFTQRHHVIATARLARPAW